MLLATIDAIDGKRVVENCGVVATQAIFGANLLRDLASAVLDLTGGRNSSYEQVFEDARRTAITTLTADARNRGANAIVGLRFDYHSLGTNGSILMVAAYGTAVQLTKSDEEKRKDEEHARRDEARYYVEIAGMEKGPFSIHQLEELREAQRIESNCRVRERDLLEVRRLADLLPSP